MNALFLEDISRFRVREVARPTLAPDGVLIRISAVGICGTDLHIFEGLANYNRDARNEPIPLARRHQVLGHELCGTVEAVGSQVTKCRPGDQVTADQVLNCFSQKRSPVCEFCDSGDSHQCDFAEEYGITGLDGAFADFMAVPETNVIVLPPDFKRTEAAMIETLGCVVHACDRVETVRTRYSFDGPRKIRYVLILGSGPGGLLFLQYLRNVQNFDGEIFVTARKPAKIEWIRKFGGTPIDVTKTDLAAEILERTQGEKTHCVFEATGSGPAFEQIPWVLRKQGTVQLYGAGHSGVDIGCLTPFQVLEFTIVASAGASGGFDADGTPTTYRRSMEYIRDRKIDVECLISHRYTQLGQMQQAFEKDSRAVDYVKGMLVRAGDE